MSLQTPDTVRRLQRTLYLKAKKETDYLLLPPVTTKCTAKTCYALSRSAGGAPGVEGQTLADIERQGGRGGFRD